MNTTIVNIGSSTAWQIYAIPISLALSLASIVVAYRAFLVNSNSFQLQTLERIFKELRDLEREKEGEGASWNQEQHRAWLIAFFNTIEYLCFIVNRRLIAGKALQDFFFEHGLDAWGRQYDKAVQAGQIQHHTDSFREFHRTRDNIGSKPKNPERAFEG